MATALSIYEPVAPEPLDSFLPVSSQATYPKHARLYDHGPERLYLVVTGRVRVYRTLENAGQVNLAIHGPGELFGLAALESCTVYESAVALDPVAVMSWTPELFQILLDTRPGMYAAFQREVLNPRLEDMTRRLLESTTVGVLRKLAIALLRLMETHGVPSDDGGVTVVMPAFTHEVLAAEISTAREHVTNAMKALQKRGVIDYDRKRIRLNLEALLNVAHPEAQ